MKLGKISVLLVSVLCLLVVTPAFAATTQTATMAVSATVAQSCTVSAGALAFGTYTGSASTAQATITVSCNVASGGATITVGLDKGSATAGNSKNPRQMSSGSNLLNYNLFQDSSLTKVWGDIADAGTYVNTTLAGTGSLTVYGQIPALQTPPTGAYTDSVKVTISY